MRSDLSVLEEFGASLAPAEDQPPVEIQTRVLNGMRQPVRRPRQPGCRTNTMERRMFSSDRGPAVVRPIWVWV